MSDNVLILGAGASKDAGVPLLAGFVEKMLDFHQRGTNGSEPLSSADKIVFQEAINVINELDGYHGRAAFDDRNIEDVLSILSFDVMAGEEVHRTKWDAIIKAIARTIDLTCVIKHDGRVPSVAGNQSNLYMDFWRGLFRRFGTDRRFPVIINLNYDLVLERALFELLDNCQYGPPDRPTQSEVLPFGGINIRYHYDDVENRAYQIQSHVYTHRAFGNAAVGTKLASSKAEQIANILDIEILKLHGSLNFSTQSRRRKTSDPALFATDFPTNQVANPYILPPIFNKLSMEDAARMWGVALTRLRNAKKVFIVGYSLPRTDIYMQYFFKTALGPNLDLRRIVVFNPLLFEDSDAAEDMEKRYGECFAPQFQKLIDFQPRSHWMSSRVSCGTFQHFCGAIEHDEDLFF